MSEPHVWIEVVVHVGQYILSKTLMPDWAGTELNMHYDQPLIDVRQERAIRGWRLTVDSEPLPQDWRGIVAADASRP